MKYRYNTPETVEHYLKFADEIYTKHISHFDSVSVKDFFANLNPDSREIFLQVCFFYYHRGWKFLNKLEFLKNEVDEGFILLSVISVIETIMHKNGYKNPFDWLKENLEKYKLSSIEMIETAKSAYFEQCGISSTFKEFLNNNLTEFDRGSLLDLIRVWNNDQKKFVEMDIMQLADMIYEMRSKFVHQAKYVPISSQADKSLGYVGQKIYTLGNFREIMDILERGIFRRFQNDIFKIK